MDKLIKDFINSVRVELADEFDMNFRRKAFFNKKWPKTKHKYNKGSLLMRDGTLRQSISSKVDGNSIQFTSSVDYAKIHNEGGQIVVNAKMKKFFWAMHYKAAGAITYKIKDRQMNNNKRNRKLDAEAQKWKAMALMKVGSVIKIEQRQFIGYHPQVKKAIERVFKEDFAPKFKDLIIKTIKK